MPHAALGILGAYSAVLFLILANCLVRVAAIILGIWGSAPAVGRLSPTLINGGPASCSIGVCLQI